jgi:CRP/FNR family transcriptional regulator, cyclic AMP receptor protein
MLVLEPRTYPARTYPAGTMRNSTRNHNAAFGQPRITDCATCAHRTSRLFCNLKQEALDAFGEIGTRASFPRGAIIFTEGDNAESVVVLCSGQVKLSCTSRDGKTMILKIAGAGDVLGLGAVVAGAAYELTAQAIEPVQINTIRRKDFLAFLNQHGEASMHAAQALGTEYKTAFMDARLLALATSASSRLARVLIDWARTASGSREELKFTMALTHEELGNMSGTSRETVTRLLGRFQKDKLIEIHGATIRILAPQKFEDLAIA